MLSQLSNRLGNTGYKVHELVSTFFHPANRPIDFLKSFWPFFINSVRVRVRVRVGVRVGVGFGLVT